MIPNIKESNDVQWLTVTLKVCTVIHSDQYVQNGTFPDCTGEDNHVFGTPCINVVTTVLASLLNNSEKLVKPETVVESCQ